MTASYATCTHVLHVTHVNPPPAVLPCADGLKMASLQPPWRGQDQCHASSSQAFLSGRHSKARMAGLYDTGTSGGAATAVGAALQQDCLAELLLAFKSFQPQSLRLRRGGHAVGMQGPMDTGCLRLLMPASHCCLIAKFEGFNILRWCYYVAKM